MSKKGFNLESIINSKWNFRAIITIVIMMIILILTQYHTNKDIICRALVIGSVILVSDCCMLTIFSKNKKNYLIPLILAILLLLVSLFSF